MILDAWNSNAWKKIDFFQNRNPVPLQKAVAILQMPLKRQKKNDHNDTKDFKDIMDDRKCFSVVIVFKVVMVVLSFLSHFLIE